MKNFLQFCAFLVYATIFLTNCKPKSVDPSPSAISTSTSTISTSTSTGTSTTIGIIYSTSPGFNTNKVSTPADGGAYILNGKLYIICPSLAINYIVNGTTTGIYQDPITSGNSTSHGEVTLDLVDISNRKVSGSFKKGLYNGSYQTFGNFNSIPLSTHPAYLAIGPNNVDTIGVGFLNAVVNFWAYALLTPDNLHPENTKEPFIFVYTKSDNLVFYSYSQSVMMNFNIPSTIMPGIYKSDTLGVKMTFESTGGDLPKSPQKGSAKYLKNNLTISSNDFVNKEIIGQFEADFHYSYFVYHRYSITGGNFKIHYK